MCVYIYSFIIVFNVMIFRPKHVVESNGRTCVLIGLSVILLMLIINPLLHIILCGVLIHNFKD